MEVSFVAVENELWLFSARSIKARNQPEEIEDNYLVDEV